MRGKLQSVNISFQSGDCTGTYEIMYYSIRESYIIAVPMITMKKRSIYGQVEKR